VLKEKNNAKNTGPVDKDKDLQKQQGQGQGL